jgi:hemoglobin/transferrin/lactoferrin receptor protein
MPSVHSLTRPVAALAFAAAVAWSLVPAPAAAEANAQSAFADTSKPVTFLKETVVTGARYPRRYYESPQALSFISRNQLRDMAPVVIGDALQQLPGVDNSKDSPWEQRIVLRGLSGQRVLVLVDGIPMNSARGNGPHPSLVATSLIDRVEVVRGPSSVSYGSDAIGGAINIITRDVETGVGGAGTGMSGSARLDGGSADHVFGGQVEVRPRMGKLGAMFTGGWHNADNFDAPSGEVPNSAYKDWNGAGSLRYELSDRFTLRSGYQAYRGTDIGIPGLSFAFPGASQAFSFSYYDRDLVHLTLDERYDNSWLENTRIRAYWQRERRNFFSTQNLDAANAPLFGVAPRPGMSFVLTDQDRFFDLSTLGAQIQLTSKRQQGYRWTAGLDAASDRTSGDNIRRRTYHFPSVAGPDSAGATAFRATQSVPDGQFDNYGAYFQNDWYLSPKWTLSTGARATFYHYLAKAGPLAPGFSFTERSQDNSALSGSLGLVYEPVKDLHVSANIANGYRQPNAQDLFFDGAASVGFVIGNPDLDPETNISYDLGLRWGVGRVALSGNVFLSTYKDLIDALPVASVPEAQGQPTYKYTNIAEARMWGGEAEGEVSFLRDWRARASIAGTVGEITSQDAILKLYGVAGQDRAPLTGVPPLKGGMSLRWNERESRAWVEAGSRWSWRTNRLPLPTPGVGQLTDFKKEWIVADLSAGVKTPSGQRLVLGIRNLTDREYRQALGSLNEPGRSFYASLSTDF